MQKTYHYQLTMTSNVCMILLNNSSGSLENIYALNAYYVVT